MNSSVFRRDLNVPKVLADLVDSDREFQTVFIRSNTTFAECSNGNMNTLLARMTDSYTFTFNEIHSTAHKRGSQLTSMRRINQLWLSVKNGEVRPVNAQCTTLTQIDVVNGRTLRKRRVSEERVERFLLGLSDGITVQQFTDNVFLAGNFRHNVHRLPARTVTSS